MELLPYPRIEIGNAPAARSDRAASTTGSPAELIAKIYEAAFVPDLWTEVLEDLVPLSGSACAEMVIYDGAELHHGRASSLTRDAFSEYIHSGIWRQSESYMSRFGQAPLDDQHFHHSDDVLGKEAFARSVVGQTMDRLGLGGQLVTAVPMPTGEMLLVTFERLKHDGRHSAQGIAQLTAMRPHLARAALLASRLGFERARGALAAMTALDLPAALVDRQGRLREANALMTPALLDTRGGERVMLGDPMAQALLDACVAGHGPTRSIALPPRAERPARVMHVVPLAPAVRDPLASATTLLVLNVAGPSGPQPDLTILRALFDLSPAESRLAALLATGIDLAGAAAQTGVQISTARTHLERIFEKTGCHRQGELVLLLAGLVALPVVGRSGKPE